MYRSESDTKETAKSDLASSSSDSIGCLTTHTPLRSERSGPPCRANVLTSAKVSWLTDGRDDRLKGPGVLEVAAWEFLRSNSFNARLVNQTFDRQSHNVTGAVGSVVWWVDFGFFNEDCDMSLSRVSRWRLRWLEGCSSDMKRLSGPQGRKGGRKPISRRSQM